jgi:hypothetical protein
MALPASGAISFNAINVELGLTATAQISLNDSAVRTLFGVSSGAISMSQGYGKSNRVSVTVTLASNQINYTLGTAQIPGYASGTTDVTLVVNSGVYVYSTNTANAGLTVAALAAGDTVSIINNGFIIGQGGAGGAASNGADGGPAITINYPINVTNNSYIAGGGGGGGGATTGTIFGGGGGAGGGAGGTGTYGSPGTGGSPGSAGTNGTVSTFGSGGGGGGRILPGVGGTSVQAAVGPNVSNSVINPGRGGGSGGSGSAGAGNAGGPTPAIANSGAGGNANVAGSSASYFSGGSGGGSGGGGGGGWGASGGRGNTSTGTSYVGGAGGKAINLNGYTATLIVTGTIYGAIS